MGIYVLVVLIYIMALPYLFIIANKNKYATI